MTQKIFFVAGDISGEIHAANLIKAIKNFEPDSYIYGLGGKNLENVVDEFCYNLVDLSAFGFLEPIKLYFKLKNIFKDKIINIWNNNKPDKVVLVDYYGFNIYVAQEAKKQKIPVYYYISPQIWASRPGRIKKIAKYVDKMLVILPFEEQIYKKYGVDVTFVGHPLVDMVPVPNLFEEKYLEKPIVGFFPGSRKSVIKNHLDLLYLVSKNIKKLFPESSFKILGFKKYGKIYESYPFPVITENDFAQRKNITLALSVSGTVSLENALLGIPMIVFYKLSWFNYILVKSLIKIPHFTMVNILFGNTVVPELAQKTANPENITSEIIRLLKNKTYYENTKRKLASVRSLLGEYGVNQRAAKIILGKMI